MRQLIYQIRQIIKLGVPVFIGQLIQTLMSFTDTVMAGHVSAVDMAAVAIGASLWFPVILFVLGLLMPITPVISHHFGSREFRNIPATVWQGIYLALFTGILAMAVLGLSHYLLTHMELEPSLYKLSIGYLDSILWGAPAFAVFQILRNCGEGISYTKPTMVVSLIGLISNVILNYTFIYGHFGAPALGGAGCGVASAITCWLMMFAMMLFIRLDDAFKDIQLIKYKVGVDLKTQFGMIRLGLPVALATFFEVTLFAAIALLIAPLGATVVASHQIAINFSSLVFMLPLSIGIAVSIRIGYYLGKNKKEHAKMSTKSAITLGVLMALCTCSLTLVGRYAIAKIYTDDMQVIELTMSILYLAALYQFSDAVQVICAGVLRGYGDTKACFYITFFSYWIVGLTLGYFLALTDTIIPRLGVMGFWIGVMVGLTCAALLFILRVIYIEKNYTDHNFIK